MTHINSKALSELQCSYNAANHKNYQQSFLTSVAAVENKKQIVIDLVKTWVEADISIKKVDKLHDFFKKHCNEGGAILTADAIRR